MYLIRYPLLLILFLSGSYSVADNPKQIELLDGSIISGEVISLVDGVYTIQSASLGTLTISEAKIASIHLQTKPQKATSPSATPTLPPLTLQTLQGITGDEEVMGMIFALQNDPTIQEILSNPAMVEAAKSGDLPTLLADPTFMELLENPQIQAIQKKLSQ